jgi:hypothetical protein
MKTNFFRSAFVACVSMALLATVYTSCTPEESTTADTTILVAVIDSCQTLADAATTTDYPQLAITTFKSALSVAKTAILDKKITQTAIDNLVVSLRAAKATFLASAYDAIPSASLLMGLSFNEGTGTQLTAAGKNWTAVLKKGPAEIFGTGTNFPSFVDGKIGKAMYFSNGSHLEIADYTANDLLGSKLSIAVWVKPDSTRAGNYIMSYNYWNSWKFQLQEQNKPFFTIHTNADGWVDADNQADFSAPNDAWTHLVVTLDMTTKLLTFYVNGAVTMEWNATTKAGLTGTGPFVYATTLPLMIGACTTYAEANAWTWSWTHTPANWDGFYGAMDELKMYNIALTEGQVSKLYNEEK